MSEDGWADNEDLLESGNDTPYFGWLAVTKNVEKGA